MVEFYEQTGSKIRMELVLMELGPVAGVSGNHTTIEEQLAEIRADIKQRHHNDSLVMARIRKEIDHMINIKRGQIGSYRHGDESCYA